MCLGNFIGNFCFFEIRNLNEVQFFRCISQKRNLNNTDRYSIILNENLNRQLN